MNNYIITISGVYSDAKFEMSLSLEHYELLKRISEKTKEIYSKLEDYTPIFNVWTLDEFKNSD